MDNMIHTLNKVILSNQQKIPRKLKTRKTTHLSKRILNQEKPEKKLEENTLKKNPFMGSSNFNIFYNILFELFFTTIFS